MAKADHLRMASWLLLSAACYGLALSATLQPQIETLFWKLGHVTVAAHVGYFVSRHAIGRLTTSSPPIDKMARAIIIGAAMLSISLGL